MKPIILLFIILFFISPFANASWKGNVGIDKMTDKKYSELIYVEPDFYLFYFCDQNYATGYFDLIKRGDLNWFSGIYGQVDGNIRFDKQKIIGGIAERYDGTVNEIKIKPDMEESKLVSLLKKSNKLLIEINHRDYYEVNLIGFTKAYNSVCKL